MHVQLGSGDFSCRQRCPVLLFFPVLHPPSQSPPVFLAPPPARLPLQEDSEPLELVELLQQASKANDDLAVILVPDKAGKVREGGRHQARAARAGVPHRGSTRQTPPSQPPCAYLRCVLGCASAWESLLTPACPVQHTPASLRLPCFVRSA